ncbi:zf-DHHC-domain-containing protein [Rhizoclosmatium globosum]|uniref:Palmitoyltransferase n=1 Tax=Rhizoclosmatium globosum TaxID=329046 RepID=A0A1Y2D3J5_9FUNG|nr:zf-DHHC-domain-containing protein [Rhizoclosmatium globosum]|eukprot:ORY53714.1 zf-DHHC-domain-containing protein [Rhizoclosmatium globosum]
MVVCIIGTTLFIHLTTMFCILVPWLWPLRTLLSKLSFLVLNASTSLLLINYYLCIVSNPGTVYSYYQPPPETALELTPVMDYLEVDPATDVLSPHYCHSCQRYKPPRAHHCRYCSRCILRMDHHCSWIANCVGHGNQAHFIRFLFWSCISCWCCVLVIVARLEVVLVGAVRGHSNLEMESGELIIVCMNVVVLTPMVTMVSMLFYNQIQLLLTNETTIENLKKNRYSSYSYAGRRVDLNENPYDLGNWFENVQQVLGENPLFWLLPNFQFHSKPSWSGVSGDEEVWHRDGHWFPIGTHVQRILHE